MNKTLVPLLGALLLLAGCETTPRTNLAPVILGEGFETFPSPRDYDTPGQVYRIDPQGGMWRVGAIAVTPMQGNDWIGKYSSTSDWSLNTVLKTMNVAAEKLPASLTADLTRTRTASIDSTQATRVYIVDSDTPLAKVLELLRRSEYRKDNKYFLIRETVAAKEIKYSTKRDWNANLNLEAEIAKAVSSKTGTKLTNGDTFEIATTFDKPMQIWYKAERIQPVEGFGLTASGVVPPIELIPATKGEFKLGTEKPPQDASVKNPN